MDQPRKPGTQPEELNTIVSVNSQQPPPGGLVAKLVLMTVALAVLAVSAVMGYNRYRAHARDKEARQDAELKAGATRPALPHHTFGDGAPPAPTAGTTPTSARSLCADGKEGAVLRGTDGMPIISPSGLPVRMCANGQLQIPGLGPDDAAAAAGGTPPRPAPPATPSPSRHSRYDGDILLPSSVAVHPSGEPAQAGPDLANPLLQALLASSALQTAGPGAAPASAPLAPVAPATAPSEMPTTAHQTPAASVPGALQQLTQTSRVPAVKATMIGDRDMILPEGRSIDCNLSLRLVNEVSGQATCVVSSYVYGDSGRVVLIEPGSIATGEYNAQMAHGQRRLFVLWTRLKTANGVVINLNSPAADALGTSGLDGSIDNHWSERLGAAFLLSAVQDVVGYETAKAASNNAGSGGVTVLQNTTETGNHMAERILDSTIGIKPTIYKRQGDRATIAVARDLDFGGVYALRAK